MLDAVGGFEDDVVRWGAFKPEPDWRGPAYTTANIHPGIFQFGSSHVAGAFFVMCDSSVRMVRYEVDPELFRRASSRNDRQAFGPDSL